MSTNDPQNSWQPQDSDETHAMPTQPTSQGEMEQRHGQGQSTSSQEADEATQPHVAQHETQGNRVAQEQDMTAVQPQSWSSSEGSQPSGHQPDQSSMSQGQYGQSSMGQYGQNQQYGLDAQSGYGAYGQQNASQGQYGQDQQYGQQYGQGSYGQSSSPQQSYQGQYGQNASQYTQGYDQNAYGQGQYGGPQSYAQPLAAPAASYGSRVGAYLLDGLLSMIPLVVLSGLGIWLALKDAYEVPSNDPFHPDETTIDGINGSGFAVIGLGLLVSLLFQVWNRGLRQGKTGQSLGKKMLHISVLDERTGRPAGAGAGAGRFGVEFGIGIVNMIAQVLSILDLLWPLWDNKKQTLHDKVVHTVVVQGDPQV